ncbi:MAG: DUF3372 domain-containing protein [Verrucomicrobiota bacterium JB022]|nr:DUF3372 domain-containing protein [Verrucomicrobiota bacterium JB022]
MPDSASTEPQPITGAAARWLQRDAISWPLKSADGLHFKLYAHPTGEILRHESAVLTADGGRDFPLEVITDQTRLGQLHRDYPWTGQQVLLDTCQASDLEALAAGHLVIVALDGNGKVVDATGIQNAGLLDSLYTYDGPLGVIWKSGVPTLRVWAPTAHEVKVRVSARAEDHGSFQLVPLERLSGEGERGVWEIRGRRDWKGCFYRFQATVYDPMAGRVCTHEVIDPYAPSLATDSRFGQIVHLDDAELQPKGWNRLAKPGLPMVDWVIYELHVRDFSINDESVPAHLRGSFAAFTCTESTGMQHLKAHAEAGLTHVHLLPIYDFGSTPEAGPHLREFWPKPDGHGPASEEPQAIVERHRDEDGFNWGYDPVHYFVPEGSYATDPHGAPRVRELREAVQALHGIGLRVVQDVVFNHTFQNGHGDKSVFDKLVPGYYYRRTRQGHAYDHVCCPELATEHRMVEKLMVDAIVHWARVYKIDGFRFDIMGDHTVANLKAVRKALDELSLEEHGVDGPRIHLYGEGWAFGSLLDFRRGEAAFQDNLGGTGIGSFNDRIRDGLGHKKQRGFIDGEFRRINWVRNGLAGNLVNVSLPGVDAGGTYTQQPQENVNYLTAHDNYTLFDELMLRHGRHDSRPEELARIIRRARLGLACLAVGQGVPFFHAGVELLRSKSGDRNSYNSGDWFNRVFWDASHNNWAVGLPPGNDHDNRANWPHWQATMPNEALRPSPEQIAAQRDYFRQLLALRKSSPLFRLRTAEDVQRCLTFLNPGSAENPGLIALSLADLGEERLDPDRAWILLLLNGDDREITFRHAALNEVEQGLHPISHAALEGTDLPADQVMGEGQVRVPPLSLVVLTARQVPKSLGAPGEDLPIYAVDIFVRGSMNDWGNAGLGDRERLRYEGRRVYGLSLDLPAGDHEFKLADADWTDANFGGAGALELGTPFRLSGTGNASNLTLRLSEPGRYRFTLDFRSGLHAPKLTVTKE